MNKIFTLLTVLLTGLLFTPAANAQLIINEVLYDPSNNALDGDANGDGIYDQEGDSFIEFVNTGSTGFDASGYQIWDDTINGQLRFVVPAGTIVPPNGAMVVFGTAPVGNFGGAIVLSADTTPSNLNLNNSGEVIVIKDASGTTVLTFDSDALSNNPNESYTRYPDVTGGFIQHNDSTAVLFSPGTMADGTPFNTKFPIDLPITWDDSATVDYTVIDFGGNASLLAADPLNATNLVLQSTKTSGAQTWAGTTLGAALANPIPFSAGNTTIKAVIYAPAAGLSVKMKAEDQNDPTRSVETDAVTTVAAGWDTLTFNFANQSSGTAAINFGYTYDKLSIFYDFGNAGAGDIFYLDWINFVPGGSVPSGPDTVTFRVDLSTYSGSFTTAYVNGTFNGWCGTCNPMSDPDGDNIWEVALPIADDTIEYKFTLDGWAVQENLTAGMSCVVTNGGFTNRSLIINSDTILPAFCWESCMTCSPSTGGSAYCATEVKHLGIPAEIASAIYLTISNVDPSTMIVEIESANSDPVDLLLVIGGSGATISPENTSVPGKISRTLSWATTPPASVSLNILWSKVSFAGNWQLSAMNISVPFADACSVTKMPIDLPITWDDSANVDYTVIDFGGNASMLTTDPMNASNLVMQSIKTAGAQTWAGTTLGNALANPIPFSAGNTVVKAVVYAPAAGLTVKMKTEDQNDPTKSVETDAITALAGAWDTLTFDFANQSSGTAAINFANTYDKVSIFYDFGTAGAADTFYVDWIDFVPAGSGPSKAPIDLPITWDDSANVDYTVIDFGGNASMLTTDPMNASNLVMQSIKTAGAQTWAGTTLGNALANPIPFSAGNTLVKAVVYAPATGLAVRMKAEDQNDPTKSVETEALTAVAGAWDTLTFDFANQASGTAPIDFSYTYDKLSIFYDFGTAGAADTFYVDYINFSTGGGTPATPDTVTFRVDLSNYTGTFTTAHLNGTFNGWCGACNPMSDPDNDSIWEVTLPILSDTIEYKFTLDGWTAQENLMPGMSCVVTNGGFTNRYLVITSDTVLPVVCWESCDSCSTNSGPSKAPIALPITWDDTANVNYTVLDFGGNASMLTNDPMNASNLVMRSIKTAGAQTWAGTSFGNSLAAPIPFSAGNTVIKALVYAPAAGLPVRMKAEDKNDPTKSVETEALTAVAGAWDTLTFDFANQAAGTAPINFTYTFDKLSIFYDFGTAGAADTFYVDYVNFGGSGGTPVSRNVTFRVDLSQYTGSWTQVNLNGTFNNWCGTCAVMTDPNNDSIYEITVNVTTDTIEYKFTLDGWTVDEQFAGGEPCTKTTGGFTNRMLAPSGDTTLPEVCWESCTTCGGAPSNRNVTFRVDLSEYTGSWTQVNLNGTFNNWCGTCAVMTDANNDSIYELTVAVPTDTIEYKFTLDGWTVDEQFAGGEPCTYTSGGFTNRFLPPTGDTTLPEVCWESCVECSGIGLTENDWIHGFSIAPNPSTGVFSISAELGVPGDYLLRIVDLQGRVLFNETGHANMISQRVDLSRFRSGVYLVSITTELGTESKRIVISN